MSQPEQRSGQPAPFEAPASLPRRVRGTGDRPRPPARVARPVLPESFLERVRAAAEAARREEEHASSDTPAAVVPATTGSAFVPPSREAPATGAPATKRPQPERPRPKRHAPQAAPPSATARHRRPGARTRRPPRPRPRCRSGYGVGMTGPGRLRGWPGRRCRQLSWNVYGPRYRPTLTPRLRITATKPPSRCPAVIGRAPGGPQPPAALHSPRPLQRSRRPGLRPRLQVNRSRSRSRSSRRR